MPALRRLCALAEIDEAEREALRHAARYARKLESRREFLSEGAPQQAPWLVLEGWVCRTHLLIDGRRQITQIYLPGEMIGDFAVTGHGAPAALLALTPVSLCLAPQPVSPRGGLAQAYAASRALEERHVLRHITRLGRMSAYERIVDWFCEVHERLGISGSRDGDTMTVPLTQEVLADTLGLTSVHVNRTLRDLRRDDLVRVDGRTVRLNDFAACKAVVEFRRPPRLAV